MLCHASSCDLWLLLESVEMQNRSPVSMKGPSVTGGKEDAMLRACSVQFSWRWLVSYRECLQAAFRSGFFASGSSPWSLLYWGPPRHSQAPWFTGRTHRDQHRGIFTAVIYYSRRTQSTVNKGKGKWAKVWRKPEASSLESSANGTTQDMLKSSSHEDKMCETLPTREA